MEHVHREERPMSAGKEADEYQRTFYILSTGDRAIHCLRADCVQLQKVVHGFHCPAVRTPVFHSNLLLCFLMLFCCFFVFCFFLA